MKKTIITLLALGFATTAMAAPKVACQLNWYSMDENGVVKESKIAPSQEVTVAKPLAIAMQDFKMRSYLKQVCASDGGPCADAYEVMTTLSKGDISTSTNTYTPFSRQYLNLAVGNEIVFSLCDTVNE
jgi:hypothetical protein